MIRAKTKFGKYGYYETRVRMPRGLGVWPAFWLSPENQQWGGEIDVFEFVNNGSPADNINTIHTGAIVTPTAQIPWPGPQKLRYLYTHPSYNAKWTYWTAPFNFPDDYHVIACLWDTDDTVTIWIDGVMIVKYQYFWVHQNGADAGWASLMLNLVIGGSKWAGKNGIDTSEPQVLEARLRPKSISEAISCRPRSATSVVIFVRPTATVDVSYDRPCARRLRISCVPTEGVVQMVAAGLR